MLPGSKSAGSAAVWCERPNVAKQPLVAGSRISVRNEIRINIPSIDLELFDGRFDGRSFVVVIAEVFPILLLE
jgi:hypothetical protein